jgi:hypothetical protein
VSGLPPRTDDAPRSPTAGAFGIDYRNAVIERTSSKRALLLAWVLVDVAYTRSATSFELALRAAARFMHRDTSTALRAQRELADAGLLDVEAVGRPGPTATTRWTLILPGAVPAGAPLDGGSGGVRDGASGGARRGTTNPDPGPQKISNTRRAASARLPYVHGLASYTGCRRVRGEHGAGHKYDPLGKDRPPPDWPHERPTHAEVAEALCLGAEARA